MNVVEGIKDKNISVITQVNVSCHVVSPVPSAKKTSGPPGPKPKGSLDVEGQLNSPFQTQTSSGKGPVGSQQVCKPPQEPLPEGDFACTDSQKGSREGKGSKLSSLLQQTTHSTKTKSEMTSNLGSRCSKQIFEHKNIQNGDPRNNPDLPATRGMGDIAGFQRRLFPHAHTQKIAEYSSGFISRARHINSRPSPFTQGGKIDRSSSGYKNPPVPR